MDQKVWWLKTEDKPVRIQMFWMGQVRRDAQDHPMAIVGLPEGNVLEVPIDQLKWTEPY